MDPFHKSHYASVSYPTMHHLEQKCAHFCSKWLKMPSCGVQVMHPIIDLSDQTTRYAGSWGQVMQSFRRAPMKEMLSYLTDLLVTSTNPIKGSTAPSPHGGTDWLDHYTDVIMITMASQITSLAVVYSIVYSGANQRKTSKLRVTGLCAGIHRWINNRISQFTVYVIA